MPRQRDARVPGPVRVAADELGEDPAGLGEADVGALADGEVAEGLRICALPTPTGPNKITDSPA